MNSQYDYKFESIDDFIVWLNNYSVTSNQQFSIFSFRRHDTLDKELNYVHYKCIHHKYAFIDSNGTIHPKLICPAKIKVSYRNRGSLKNVYQITDFNVEHNHELRQETYLLNKRNYSDNIVINDLLPRFQHDQLQIKQEQINALSENKQQLNNIAVSANYNINKIHYPHSNSNYSISNSSFESNSYQNTSMNSAYHNQNYYQMNDFNYNQLYQTMQQLTEFLLREKSNEKLNMIGYMKYLWENKYQFNIEPIHH
jgi:hypothetical protein